MNVCAGSYDDVCMEEARLLEHGEVLANKVAGKLMTPVKDF